MKHKTLLLSFFMLAALVTTNIAQAHEEPAPTDAAMTGRMEERKENMNERRDMMEEKSEDLREGIKMRFDEFKKQRIGGMMEMMKKRFEWAITRLENIADRIETRIGKVEDETGTTLTEARTHLEEARVNITAATKLLAEIDTNVDSIIADETKTGERFSSFREAFGKVKEEIKSAWMHLREALQAIKGERMGEKNESIDDHTTDTNN